jgi:hypothetical protein
MHSINAVTCTIASGATGLSDAARLGGQALCGIQLPATWVAAALTFQVSYDGGATFVDLYDANDQEVTIAAPTQGHYLALNPGLFPGVAMVKVRSGTSGTPVDQTASRVLKLVTFAGNLVPGGGGGAAGATVVINGTLIRATGTTTYTAGDVIGTAASAVIVFAGCARFPNGGGLIIGARLIDEANQALKGTFELWLFHAPITVIVDNAAWIPTHAEMEKLVSIIQFQDTPMVGLAGAGVLGNLAFPAWNINRPFRCVAGSTLYGYLVVRNAYIPIESEKFQVSLGISQD